MIRSRGPSRIRSQALALGAIPTAFLLLLLAIVGVLRFQTQAAAQWVQHSEHALRIENDLTAKLIRVNSELTEYGQKPTAARSAQIDADLNVEPLAQQLVQTAQGDPAQERRAIAIAALAREFTGYFREAKAAFDAHDQRKLAAIQKTYNGRGLSIRWGQETAAFAAAEVALRDRRWTAFQSQNRVFNLVLVIGTLIGIVLTVLSSIAFARRIVGRIERLATVARELKEGRDLPTPIDGDDEIAQLDHAYHEMALAVRQREAQLQKYRLLAEQARDIIFFIRRADNKILEANAAAAQAYGYSIDELQQLDARELRARETLHRLDAELDRAEETPLVFETTHRRKDGTTFPVEVAAQSVKIGGEQLMVSIIRDITERRLAQQEIQAALKQAVSASRLKSEFLATMSHEIRTPLNAVIGMTELLLHSSLSEDQRQCATVAHDSGEALLHLINDILDFSKIEAQRVDLEIIEFKLVPLVEGVSGLFAAQAARNRVALMTYVSPSIPQTLLGDPGRVRQVLMNLAGNAVKFTQDGHVVITADFVAREDDTVAIAFAVKDSGIGIAPEALHGLFEPFRQADGSMTRRYGGTGLGLSISKALVELMGGSIAVQSAPGAGSVFSFTLDFKCAQNQPQDPLNLAAIRALVVDDDPIAREIFARYLTSWNARCDTVGDAAEGCRMVAQAAENGDPYDVVLVDMVMPHMDGFAFAQRLQSQADISATRLIMVTAYDEPERGKAAIAAGFSAYLTKPVRQSELYDCIVSRNTSAAKDGAPLAAAPGRNGNCCILVAEDNEVNREVAVRQLAKLGYATQTVPDGRRAVEAALSGQFDVILMDCQMPEMDGFEATRAIRKAEARTGKHVRIVAMTANALAEDRQACLDAGMDDYLPKPVTLNSLQRVLAGEDIREALDVRRLRDLFEDDRSALLEFLDAALPALLRLVERVETAPDAPAQLAAAHELKGAAGNTGAAELAQVAGEIEVRLRAGSPGSQQLLPKLRAAYERVEHGAHALEHQA